MRLKCKISIEFNFEKWCRIHYSVSTGPACTAWGGNISEDLIFSVSYLMHHAMSFPFVLVGPSPDQRDDAFVFVHPSPKAYVRAWGPTPRTLHQGVPGACGAALEDTDGL